MLNNPHFDISHPAPVPPVVLFLPIIPNFGTSNKANSRSKKDDFAQKPVSPHSLFLCLI